MKRVWRDAHAVAGADAEHVGRHLRREAMVHLGGGGQLLGKIFRAIEGDLIQILNVTGGVDRLARFHRAVFADAVEVLEAEADLIDVGVTPAAAADGVLVLVALASRDVADRN